MLKSGTFDVAVCCLGPAQHRGAWRREFRGSVPLKRYVETGRGMQEVGCRCLQGASGAVVVPMVKMAVKTDLNRGREEH